MKDAEIKIQLILTDAARAAILEEIASKSAHEETLEADKDALTRKLETL